MKKFLYFLKLKLQAKYVSKSQINNPANCLNTAVWFITNRCQNNCPYCWQKQDQIKGGLKPEEFIAADRWVVAWNRLKPKFLDITGGEPFLQPDFIKLLKSLDNDIKIGIVTNLNFDLTQFVQEISPEKVVSITSSFHPTSTMSRDIFIGKCLLLKNRKFNLKVNFVADPEQMWLTPFYKKLFRNAKIRFHIDPYYQIPFRPYEFSKNEKSFLKNYISYDRSPVVKSEKLSIYCNAGNGHINVQVNGDVYKCTYDKMLGKPKIGNIFDVGFKLNRDWNFCSNYYRCSNCDRDKILIKKVNRKD